MAASSGDDWISLAESNIAYNQSALIACSLAEYIRGLGYPARAHFQGTFDPPCYDVVVTPLLLLAGLGEFSRAGWALNPLLGGRFKASLVTTDLPLQPDAPVDFGLREFCRVCKRCAQECPSRAISDADVMVPRNGYLACEFDPERCTKYRIMNRGGAWCGRCVKVRPWTKPDGLTHDLVRLAIARLPRTDPLLVKLVEWLGYGRTRPKDQWWLSLERTADGFRRGRQATASEAGERRPGDVVKEIPIAAGEATGRAGDDEIPVVDLTGLGPRTRRRRRVMRRAEEQRFGRMLA